MHMHHWMHEENIEQLYAEADENLVAPDIEIDENGNKTVILSHNWSSLVPIRTVLKAWEEYTLEITPESDWLWCMSTIKMPKVDPTPKPIIEGTKITYNVKNLAPWEYDFVCNWMEMKQWSLLIEA